VLRVEDAGETLTVTSRLARPRAVAVLAGALLAVAAVAWANGAAGGAAALAAGAALAVVLGGLATRARFDRRGRVTVLAPLPFGRPVVRPLSDFHAVRVEGGEEARRRRHARLAARYRRTAGEEMPAWLVRPPEHAAGDPHRRIVLVPRSGEPLAVTSWVPEHDDLEPALRRIEALLG